MRGWCNDDSFVPIATLAYGIALAITFDCVAARSYVEFVWYNALVDVYNDSGPIKFARLFVGVFGIVVSARVTIFWVVGFLLEVETLLYF